MEIKRTEIFNKWIGKVADPIAKAAMLARIQRAAVDNNLGTIRTVGGGVSEMKIDVGAGYRMYFTIRQQTIVFLLCGGSKKTQDADIKKAQKISKTIDKAGNQT